MSGFKPTKEELSKWKKDPITIWVKKEIDLIHSDYKDAMLKGATYYQDSVERTALSTAETIGYLNGIDAIKRIEIED